VSFFGSDRRIQSIQQLKDDDAHVRDWATFALGALSTVDTSMLRDALVERLSDSDV